MSKKVLSFDDLISRSIVIQGMALDEVLESREVADQLLGRLGLGADYYQLPSDALRRLENSYDAGEPVPDALKGLSGFGVVPFLKAYAGRFEENNWEFRIKVSGKICDYVFVPDPLDGVECPSSGQAHLSVDVLHEHFETNEALANCHPNKTEFFHWDINIKKCNIYERKSLIETSSGSQFPDKPFPDLPGVNFSPHALDPNDPRSIWCRGLTHKLYATGEHVEIERVYRQICHHPADPDNDEDLRLLDGSSGYYQLPEDGESCVDIMFKGYPPLVGLPKQREYCLGRCDDPDIVNTGA